MTPRTEEGRYTVADKLREARALIERGWTQGNYVEEGCYCALGAIGMAVVGNPTAPSFMCGYPAISGVVRALGLPLGLRTSSGVADWNDAPDRTQAEVLAVFDKAIALAEQESAS